MVDVQFIGEATTNTEWQRMQGNHALGRQDLLVGRRYLFDAQLRM